MSTDIQGICAERVASLELPDVSEFMGHLDEYFVDNADTEEGCCIAEDFEKERSKAVRAAKEARNEAVDKLAEQIRRALRAEARAAALETKVRELEGTRRFLEDQLVAFGRWQ